MDTSNLDLDFNTMMSEIKNNISFLENELDMMLISCWVTKLSEPECDVEKKVRRNEYLSYLLYLLKRRMMHHPFVEEPPCGPLPPLNIDMGNTCQEDCLEDKTEFYSSEAIFPQETSEPFDFKTPFPYENPREVMPSETPGRAQSSTLNLPQSHGPLATSTPFTGRPSSRPSSQMSSPRKIGANIYSPCSPCKIYKSHLLERPGESRLEEKPNPCAFLKPPRPPPTSPDGYLDYSSEADDKPFVTPLPGSEQSKEEMERIIKSVDHCTRLFDFIRLIAPTTCDQGQILNVVATAELAQFKEFVQSMFRARMQDTEKLLVREQLKLKERYDGWEAAVYRRAQAAIRSLERLLPEFKYDHYKKDPEYLYLMLREQFSVHDGELNPQLKTIRIKAQKQRWLTDEAERMEKDNEDKLNELKELNEQLNELSKCYNAQHKDFLEKNKCLEEKAAKLRIRFHQNRKLVDLYIDELNTEPINY